MVCMCMCVNAEGMQVVSVKEKEKKWKVYECLHNHLLYHSNSWVVHIQFESSKSPIRLPFATIWTNAILPLIKS